jgi:hypothetical protein
MSIFHCSGRTKDQVRDPSLCFCYYARFYGEDLLAPHPTAKLEDHPLLAVRDSLFNIFAATLHIEGRSSTRSLRTRHAVVTGTHLSWQGPTYHGEKVPITVIMSQTIYPWQLAVNSPIPCVPTLFPSHLPNTFSPYFLMPSSLYVNMSQLILTLQSLRWKVCISNNPTRVA